MANRWHILAAKAAPTLNRSGLTNWQFGALMEKVAEQYDGVVVREATLSEKLEFRDTLLQEFHWAVALNEDVGFSAKMLVQSGIEFNFWTDSDMHPTKRAVEADPERYKYSMFLDLRGRMQVGWQRAPLSQSLPDGRNLTFAWSTDRNVAGYFLSWRQTIDSSGRFPVSGRDEVVAFKLRKDAKALALKRSQ